MAKSVARPPRSRRKEDASNTASTRAKPAVSWSNPAGDVFILTGSSALYNVLMILLHRPFVADGHLYNTSRAISVNSFMSCATAADDIVQLLRSYDKAFSVRKAPYLISYATYVAATIHARIAAKRGPGSHAHSSLEACLAVFRENQETNWAVRRANGIVQNLMKRLGVATPSLDEIQIDRDNSGGSHTSTPDTSSSRAMGREPSLQSLDIDGIIQSFVREREQESSHLAQAGAPGRMSSSDATPLTQQLWTYPNADTTDSASLHGHHDTGALPYDNNGSWLYQGQQQIFGEGPDDLLYGFNGSALDSFPSLDWDTM
jgi:hypothetical protein